jgi:hypothetical protein
MKTANFLLVSLLLFASVGFGPAAQPNRNSLAAHFGQLPISFEVNQGQTDSQVQFLARGSGYNLFLTSQEAVLRLVHRDNDCTPQAQHRKPGETPCQEKSHAAVLRMQLVGANPQAKVAGSDELPGKSNYFIGQDRRQWHTDISTYGKVRYQGVYRGVDLVYHGEQGKLEYDFEVGAGADPGQIRLGFAGVERLSLDGNGDLLLYTAEGPVREQKPVMYQEIDGVRKNLAGRYRLQGREVGFEVAAYDARKPLVIDPVLVYSTYLGGSRYGEGNGIAVDSAGNIYVAGDTYAADFPTVNPPPQESSGLNQGTASGCCPPSDAFVLKLNPAGSALVYSTFLGGSNYDYGNAIAVDSQGNAYVTGYTYSSDFPTVHPISQDTSQNRGHGCCRSDAFVTALSADGSTLLYSTYLGGSDYDYGYGIAMDSHGNAYVTGYTQSTDFPTTPSAVFPTKSKSNSYYYDVFVSKLSFDSNTSTLSLVYSTYLGGTTNYDYGYAIAADSSGNAYVTGAADSSDFPICPQSPSKPFCATTGTPLQSSHNKGNNTYASDAFVTKLNPAGSALVYSTYLGGSSYDYGYGIAVLSGNAYVTGYTESGDFPVLHPYQAGNRGRDDAFVSKLNVAGTKLVYSTYLGGGSYDYGDSIAVDSQGNAYVIGETDSSNFPTRYSLQTFNMGSSSGNYDAFVTKLNPAGSALVYSTYLGGSSDDYPSFNGNAIAIDKKGNAYVTGVTYSGDFPITGNALQQGDTTGGSGITFISKFGIAGTTTSLTSSSYTFTQGQPVYFQATVTVPGSSFGPGPTGTVTFYDSTPSSQIELAVVPLSNGMASLTTTLPAYHVQYIQAVYNGDGSYTGSKSNFVTEWMQ